jgi:hypothetical protein
MNRLRLRAFSLAGSLALAQALCSPASAVTRSFGNGPFNDVITNSSNAARCTGLTTSELAAMVLAPTWGETGAGTSAPSPMTLSRWDTGVDRLYESATHTTAYVRDFFHPGVGMWQLDSAGLGKTVPTWKAISSWYASQVVATYMANKYCTSGASTAAGKRASAWAAWFACSTAPTCETIYNDIYDSATDDIDNVPGTTTVTRNGGMLSRTCRDLNNAGRAGPRL